MRGTQTAGSVIGTSIYPGNKINVKNGDVLIVYVSDGKETVTTTEKVTETQSETKQEPVQSETKPTQTAANTEKSQPAPEE